MIYRYTEKEQLVHELRKKGNTYKSIGEQMGFSASRARQLDGRYQVKAKYNALLSDYVKGNSVESLATKYEYPLSTVNSLVGKYQRKMKLSQ